MEWARLRLGQEKPGLALLGDAAAGGAMSDNEGIEGEKQQKLGDGPLPHARPRKQNNLGAFAQVTCVTPLGFKPRTFRTGI